MLKKIILLVAIVLLSQDLLALKSEDSLCMNELKNSILKNRILPDSSRTFFYEYIIKVKNKINVDVEHESNIKLYFNLSQMVLISSQMEVYQNDTISITILPDVMKIYINDAKKQKNPLKQLEQINKMNDLIFNNCSIETCEYLNKMKQKIIKVKVGEFKNNPISGALVTYTLNELKNILSLNINYKNDKELDNIYIEFVKTDFNFDWKHKNKDIKYYVFQENNNLLKKYENFQLIDNRKRNQ